MLFVCVCLHMELEMASNELVVPTTNERLRECNGRTYFIILLSYFNNYTSSSTTYGASSTSTSSYIAIITFASQILRMFSQSVCVCDEWNRNGSTGSSTKQSVHSFSTLNSFHFIRLYVFARSGRVYFIASNKYILIT